ncbi:hypothetical protein [Treponema endosymbiont of Eucomonympha sp.]|uniref:hypothetical protein n=1 Tax=Treponema endosymbiont of Eucomonympha sp. TaxID=1580831 RepID=UPI000B228033|nr:hypothetical protein [Treponema endosymbiont of Eucomonympha sp.]
MTNTSFRAAGFALALALAAGGCPHNADSPAPPVAVQFLSLTADGGAAAGTTTLTLTLTFSQAVPGLSAADITLEGGGTGIQKGALSKGVALADGVAYTLSVSGINRLGDVAVSVSKAGYSFGKGRQAVTVYPAPTKVTFISLTDNGVEATTTALTLVFDTAIEGLSAEDITLTDGGSTGASKGELSQTLVPNAYRLTVDGITKSGDVTVKVHKAGYAFSPDTLTAKARAPTVAVRFLSLAANGGETAGTTALTLTFDKAIAGLSAEDITLTDDGYTGIRAGALTAAGAVYTLAVSGTTRNGFVSVKIAKAGYAFPPEDTRSVQVYLTPIVKAAFLSLAANGGETAGTTALTLTFDKAITGLSTEDIALTDDDGTDIRAGALTAAGAGTGGKVYTLAVSGITKNGSVSVKAHKAGYAFSPDTQSAQVHPAPTAITFINLTADGLKSTTAALTLIFDRPVPGGLTAANITLTDTGYTGIRAGALTDEGGGAYRLAVSGIRRSGDVTVQVHKAGYAFTPDTRTAQARAPIVKAAFTSLWQNDYRGGRTYDMTLVFDQAIPGLTAANIAFTDTGGTGIQKGALEDKGGGAYLLKVSGIWRSGEVTVKAASAGYAFSPDTQSARVLAPQIWFESFTADGSAEKGTLALTLTFSRAVSGLTADDITLSDPGGTGIQKAGALTRTGTSGTVYTLAVSGITKNGSVSAKVAEKAGNTFADSPAAQVYKPPEIAFASLAADGGDGVVTAGLTLQFGKAVPGLSAADITLTDTDNTGIQKGALTDKGGGAYALAVSGITKGGAVTVKAAKAGYAFSPPARTAAVRYGEPVPAEFLSLTEDGYAAGRTTALTLTFDRVIGGLTAGDITLTDTDGTGIRKGTLTDKGGGAYALAVSGVTKNGSITARVSKAGYTFARDTLPARVYWGTEFISLAAEGGTAETTALTLLFDRPVPGLTAADIALTDTGGTGIRLRAGGFTHLGGIYAPGAYRLAVSGITKSGTVTAKAAKAGYAFSPDTQSAQVYAKPVPAAFVSLAQIDEGSAGTKALALTFDQVIPGLSADDITITDTGNTGIRLRAGGIVTQPGGRYPPETYFLAVTGVTKDGTVTVKVRKAEWAFAPDTQSVKVWWTKPEIEFRSLSTEEGPAGTKALILTFDRPVPGGLSAANIALTGNGYTGIQKGALTDSGGGTYRLAVSNVTKNGTATVNVSKEGYAFIPRSRTADVYESPTAVAFQSLTAIPETERTTALALKFNKAIAGFSMSDITFTDTGNTGGKPLELRDKGGGEYWLMFQTNTLIYSGEVTVKVAKAGYVFTPDTRVAQVSSTATAAFLSVTATPETERTTALTLKFNKVILGLTAGDIALTDTGGTGIRKGALTDKGGGTYALAVSGIAKNGTVTVWVSKAGYVFTPDTRAAQVWLTIPVAFQSLTQWPLVGSSNGLTLKFDKVIPGFSMSDITIVNDGGTGVKPSDTLENDGGGSYRYIFKLWSAKHNGEVTVKVHKEGYTFTPDTRTVYVSGG